MPDEKDPAGPDDQPVESSAPAEPAAEASAEDEAQAGTEVEARTEVEGGTEVAGGTEAQAGTEVKNGAAAKAAGVEAKAGAAAKAGVAPPIIVSASGIPMIPGVGTADAATGAWSGLLPPPRDPASGPWAATARPVRDDNSDAADSDVDQEDEADPESGATDLTDEDLTAQALSATDQADDLDKAGPDDDEVEDRENLDAADLDEPGPGDFDDDEDDGEDGADDESKPSWQKDISADAPRRRQLSPEVKVAAIGLLAAALLITGAVLISKAVSGSSDSSSDTLNALTTPSTKPLETTKVGDCVYTADGQQPARPVKLPPSGPKVDTKPATMTINTNYGAMVVALDAAKAPCTVHAIEYLAQQKFFDNTTCHRETSGPDATIYVLQCGDPTGQGDGTPGFSYKNENTNGVNYNRGVLAMANGGPDTNGSQFFINYADPSEEGAQALAGGYTVFGQITQGLDVLDRITGPGAVGEGGDGAPASKPEITSITVTQ
jgi:cyclophilin family peptidyl-prolyl cis-trans isomerase